MTDPSFLTKDELVTLTGYKQPRKQASHLRTQRIPYHTNKAGHPIVARAVVEGGKPKATKQQTQWEPKWHVASA